MIIVTDTIFIDSDEQQWTARKKQISKSGKSKGNEVTVLIGYYPSIEAALRGILRNEYGGRMNNETMMIQQAIAEYERLTREVTEHLDAKTTLS